MRLLPRLMLVVYTIGARSSLTQPHVLLSLEHGPSVQHQNHTATAHTYYLCVHVCALACIRCCTPRSGTSLHVRTRVYAVAHQEAGLRCMCARACIRCCTPRSGTSLKQAHTPACELNPFSLVGLYVHQPRVQMLRISRGACHG